MLHREGVLYTGHRLFSALRLFLRPIGVGDILLISGGTGDSARYRTIHVAEELSLRGLRAKTTIQDHPGLVAAVGQFQIFVLHRTHMTSSLAQWLERAKALGKTIIFETDDLVFDPAFLPHMDYYQQMNALERKQYQHGVGGEILTDPYVMVATTTTTFLAEKLRERGKQVFVVPNKLSEQDVLWADEAMKRRLGANDQKLGGINAHLVIRNPQTIRIGYLSGTPSHNKDFATITPVLLRLFEQYPTIRLVLAGPLETDHALNQYTDRIERLPFVPREEFFANIASLDINLAPLEIGNPFCEAKSELKFFEAGIVRVPTVAAATQTFREAIVDGVDGFIANTEEEWYDKLSRLIEQGDLRTKLGEAAYQTALERYTTRQATNPEYYEYLRSKLKQ